MVPGPAAVAAPTFNLFGDATLISPGHNSNTAAQLRSNVSGGGLAFGGGNFATPAGMTLNQLANPSPEDTFTTPRCGGGPPRVPANTAGKNNPGYLRPPAHHT